jgi:large subunit ribosomal protein L4
MSAVQVRNLKNEELRSFELPEMVFAYPAKPHLVYEAVCHYRAVARAGTHSTRNRVDVAGGGRKPYAQKKTGRARAGSTRSPLWRGGGTVHGPKPRNYGYNFPKRMRWNAIRSVLSEKVREGNLMVVEDLQVGSHKTRDLLKTLDTMKLTGSKALLVDVDIHESLGLASRNLKKVKTMRVMGLNAYDLLDSDVVILSVPAVERLKEWLGR